MSTIVLLDGVGPEVGMSLRPGRLLARGACGGGKEDPGTDGDTDPGGEPGDQLGASAEVWTSLDAAAHRYVELRREQGESEARVALLDELNGGWDLVDRADLTDDGYTVAVLFDDGTTGAVITYAGLSLGSPEGPPPPLQPLAAPAPPAPAASGGSACDPGVSCPQSHHVRIFNAGSISNPASREWTAYLRNQLVVRGWDADDVEIVERTTNGELLGPDRLLDMSGEGLVFNVGHGGHWGGLDWGDPDQHYLQVSSTGDYAALLGDERRDEYLQYEGTLLGPAVVPVTDASGAHTGETTREILMAPELLGKLGTVDPGTMLFTTSCNSVGVSEVLMEAGLGTCVTWDGKANDMDATEAYLAMIDAMLEGATQEEALAGLSSSEATTPEGAKVELAGTDADAYLPAWGSATLSQEALPAGADHWQLTLPTAPAARVFDDLQPGDAIDVDGLPPVAMQGVLRAVAADGEIVETRTVSVDLEPGGGNDLALAGSASIGLVLSADPTTVAADGKSAATVTAELRAFQASDTIEPTGQGVACMTVEFDASLGEFVGPASGTSNGDGAVEVGLVSAEPGTSTVHAFVLADGIEQISPVEVLFSGYYVYRTGGIYPDGNPYDETTQIYDTLMVYDSDWNNLCTGWWPGWIESYSGGCSDSDDSWTFGFGEFLDFDGGCGAYGYVEGDLQPDIRYGIAASLTWEDETLTDVLLGYDTEAETWRPIGGYRWEEWEKGAESGLYILYYTDFGEPSWL